MSTLNFFTKEDGKDALTGEAVNKKKAAKEFFEFIPLQV
jgi:hypothetical protein